MAGVGSVWPCATAPPAGIPHRSGTRSRRGLYHLVDRPVAVADPVGRVGIALVRRRVVVPRRHVEHGARGENRRMCVRVRDLPHDVEPRHIGQKVHAAIRTEDGKYLDQVFVNPNGVAGPMTAGSLAFSPDARQQFLYVGTTTTATSTSSTAKRWK